MLTALFTNLFETTNALTGRPRYKIYEGTLPTNARATAVCGKVHLRFYNRQYSFFSPPYPTKQTIKPTTERLANLYCLL